MIHSIVRSQKVLSTCRLYSTGRRFAKTHEWVTLESNSSATIGITDYAQKELGDVVYIDLPELSRVVTKDEVVAVVESVKAASDIMAPLSGTVTLANKHLESAPQLLNTSPLEDGWIAKITVSNAAEFESLMTEEQYNSYVSTLAHE